MVSKVQAWGNSLGVRITKAVAEALRLRPGAGVEIKVVHGSLVITPTARRRYRLADLVEQIHRRNLHGEVDLGAPRGREAL